MKAKRSEKEVEWDEQKDVCAFGAFQYLAKIYLNRRTKVFQQLTHQWIIAFCPFGERAREEEKQSNAYIWWQKNKWNTTEI